MKERLLYTISDEYCTSLYSYVYIYLNLLGNFLLRSNRSAVDKMSLLLLHV